MENFEDDLGAEPAQTGSKQSHDPPTTLYLFGRTGREKEEWFRHLLLASTDTEVEMEKDRQRHGRCVPRLGRRNITKCTSLEKQRFIQIQHSVSESIIDYIYLDSQSHFPSRE